MTTVIKQIIKSCAYSIAPKVAATWDERLWLGKKTHELLERARGCESPQDYVSALRATGAMIPLQKWSELAQLLDIVAKLRPLRICEIGSAGGGTLFLFSQLSELNSLILSIDIAYTQAKRRCFPMFPRSGSRLVCIEGDSHSPATRERVVCELGGGLLDFLFIDGDHSFAGVQSDFELYAPLVRPGGIIALHDIVADSKTRMGLPSENDAGDVPVFWRQLRTQYSTWHEYIEDPNQDGYGIGVLEWPGGRG